MGHPRLPSTMLVDLPNWVGDQMMAMPALSRLVGGNRGGETVLHTRPSMVRFLSTIFPETRVIASPRKASPVSSARQLCAGGRRLEIGVTLRNSARGKILVRLCARWCAGSRGEGAVFLLSAPCEVDRSRHQVHDADSILATLGMEPADPQWHLELPACLGKTGQLDLQRLGVDQHRAIGLAPSTARGDAKRWPARRFGELATGLSERGYEPVIVIGPGEERVADEICSAADCEFPIVGGETDIAGLAAVTAGLHVLVGNDSGPMQLATRLGTPVVAIFGPTDPSRTGPLGHCQRVVCPPPSHSDCMRSISVAEVEAAVLDVVKQRQ